MGESCCLNLIGALNFAMVAKEKKKKYIHTPGFWLTLEDHVFGGCAGQSLEKQARDCSCFFMQRQVFAQKFHHPLSGTAANRRVTWFHCGGEKMSFICKITFSTATLLDMKVNMCLNYSK